MKRFRHALSCVFLAAIFVAPLPFSASVYAKPSLETSQSCTRYLAEMERFYNMPAHWLSAIASTESGRYHPELKLSVPWPWTINVKGKGYWFDSKEEAIQAVKRHQRKGIKSIDIGCMQVNYHYHGHHFSNIEEMFDPLYNVAYAAKFLRDKYDASNSWRDATSDYHSQTPKLGRRYYRKVYSRWQQVLDRLEEAATSLALNKAPGRGPTKLALTEMASRVAAQKTTMPAPKQPVRPMKISVRDPSTGESVAGSNQKRRREKGVLVIRVNNPKPPQTSPVKVTATASKEDMSKEIDLAQNEKTGEKGQFTPRLRAKKTNLSSRIDVQEDANNPFVF
jgi:hypothetical protein